MIVRTESYARPDLVKIARFPPLEQRSRRLAPQMLLCLASEAVMSTRIDQGKTKKRFLDMQSAAYLAGFSPRHFRKVIEEDHIPVTHVGNKLFIVAEDLEEWKETKGATRLRQAIQQIDGWTKRTLAYSTLLEQDGSKITEENKF
ncbi:MAG: hypothetical protein DMG13_09155 [Acidobacteria bacterium]|nr:MAG: hypothetical protein DMG13_09155 [Acidobacteriota bacterium]